MARNNRKHEPRADMKQTTNGYKLRTTNDLQLLSMILDEDLALRTRVIRFMEAQLGKQAVAIKKDKE